MHRFSRVFVPVGALSLFISEILLIAAAFVVLAFLILRVDPSVFLLSDNGLLRIALAVASILFGLYFEDLYTHIRIRSRVLLVQQLCLVMGIALLIQALVSYTNGALRLPLRLMIPASALLIVALFVWRYVFSVFVLRVVGPQRILFVGMCPLLQQMVDHIGAHPELGLETLGYVDDLDAAVPGIRRLGALDSLRSIVADLQPDRLVVGFRDRQMPMQDLLQLRYGGVAIDEVATAYEQLCGRVALSELHPAEVLLSGAYRPAAHRLAYQALAHWLLALLLVILSAPLLLLTAVLLMLFSPGPLIHRQECTGLGGRRFWLYSFNLAGSGGPELNGVQRFSWRWRLHALPRLWNILRGEMCFVGPRAERPEFVEVLSKRLPLYRQRYRLKPGLTGWAQINTPGGEPEDTVRGLEYDFYYLKNFSSGLDAYILLHTVREMLFAPVAY